MEQEPEFKVGSKVEADDGLIYVIRSNNDIPGYYHCYQEDKGPKVDVLFKGNQLTQIES